VANVRRWHNLRPHPSDRVDAARAVSALAFRSTTELHVAFRLDGDISAIVVPPPAAPRIDTELWRHTCFEAFISADGEPGYHEFNFAPSGAWATYGFRGYRDGGPLRDETMRPEIAVRSTAACLELDALVRLDRVAELYLGARLRVGLSAIVETSRGLSYWALIHPAGRPDFHRAEGFSLSLEAPES
jgi:hypothetical protein